MARIYSAFAVGLDSEIRGGREIARGSAREVAAAVLAYDGELERIVNVYEHEAGCDAHHVDQLSARGGRTRHGREVQAWSDPERREWAAALTAERYQERIARVARGMVACS